MHSDKLWNITTFFVSLCWVQISSSIFHTNSTAKVWPLLTQNAKNAKTIYSLLDCCFILVFQTLQMLDLKLLKCWWLTLWIKCSSCAILHLFQVIYIGSLSQLGWVLNILINYKSLNWNSSFIHNRLPPAQEALISKPIFIVFFQFLHLV